MSTVMSDRALAQMILEMKARKLKIVTKKKEPNSERAPSAIDDENAGKADKVGWD